VKRKLKIIQLNIHRLINYYVVIYYIFFKLFWFNIISICQIKDNKLLMFPLASFIGLIVGWRNKDHDLESTHKYFFSIIFFFNLPFYTQSRNYIEMLLGNAMFVFWKKKQEGHDVPGLLTYTASKGNGVFFSILKSVIRSKWVGHFFYLSFINFKIFVDVCYRMLLDKYLSSGHCTFRDFYTAYVN
jgi:hypothetical protein